MKNRIGLGSYYVLAGILLIMGPRSFFEVCPRGETVMKCWWSVQAELGIGIIVAVIGIMYLAFSSCVGRIAVSLTSVAVLAVAILIPSLLIGGCKKMDMACQSVTFPAIYAICAVSIIVTLINVLYLKKAGGGKNE